MNLRAIPSLALFAIGLVIALVPAAAAGPFEQVGRVEGGGPPWSSAFGPDASSFLTVKGAGSWRIGESVRVWDTRTLEPLTDPLPHKAVEYARLVDGGRTVFTAGGNEVRLWDVATSKAKVVLAIPGREITYADVSPDGSRFTTLQRRDFGRVLVWRAGDARPAVELKHRFPIASAEFDPTGARIVTREYGSPVHVWAADTGRELYPPIPSGDRSSGVHRARFDPAGTRLAVVQERGFTLVDAATGKTLADVDDLGPHIFTFRLEFSGDGRKLAVSTLDMIHHAPARVFDVATGREERKIGDAVFDCQIPAGGRWALCRKVDHSKGDDGGDESELWDLSTGKRVQTFAQEGRGHFSLDGSVLLIQSEKGVTTVWRLRRGGAGGPPG